MLKKWLLLLVWLSLLLIPLAQAAESMSLAVGDSEIIKVKGVTRVSTSNPEVIEVVVTGSQEILLNAKKPGLSVINIWGSEGIFSYRISVQEDYTYVEREIARLINNPGVKVIVNAKYVILNGSVDNTLQADQAIQYAKMYRENVVNNLNVKTKYQILLSIMVTEMKKESQKKYGFRWGSWVQTTDGVVFTEWQWAAAENPGGSISHYPGNYAVGAMLDAMQKNGDARILAAPSILTLSGKEAYFLAGGELPIPMSDGQGGLMVEWKEYGIKLKVTPTLLKEDLISLAVAPEVSSLDWANAILLDGYKIPALSTRKANTNVHFRNGTTLVIGGLLKREDSQGVFKLPILGDLPVVGALFRSKEFQRGDTELLFFVTPQIIKNDDIVDPAKITKPKNQGPFYNSEDEQ